MMAKEKEKKKSFKYGTEAAVTGISIITLIVLGQYYEWENQWVGTKYGDLGDFLGGIAGPILSVLTLFYLIKQNGDIERREQDRDEKDAERDERQALRDEKQAERDERQALRDEERDKREIARDKLEAERDKREAERDERELQRDQRDVLILKLDIYEKKVEELKKQITALSFESSTGIDAIINKTKKLADIRKVAQIEISDERFVLDFTYLMKNMNSYIHEAVMNNDSLRNYKYSGDQKVEKASYLFLDILFTRFSPELFRSSFSLLTEIKLMNRTLPLRRDYSYFLATVLFLKENDNELPPGYGIFHVIDIDRNAQRIRSNEETPGLEIP